MSGWKNIVAISAGQCHVVGLTADGSVVSAGDNEYGQCNVDNWKLFQNRDVLEQALADAQAKREEKRIARERRCIGVCQHCGGELKGFLLKKCIACGKMKNYEIKREKIMCDRENLWNSTYPLQR